MVCWQGSADGAREPERLDAQDLLEDVEALEEQRLFLGLAALHEERLLVEVAVVANLVAALHDLPAELGVALDDPARDEEAGLDAVAVEDARGCAACRSWGRRRPCDMCSGRSASAGSRWIHGLSPSRSNEIMNAHRLPLGHLIVGCSMVASAPGMRRLYRLAGHVSRRLSPWHHVCHGLSRAFPHARRMVPDGKRSGTEGSTSERRATLPPAWPGTTTRQRSTSSIEAGR